MPGTKRSISDLLNSNSERDAIPEKKLLGTTQDDAPKTLVSRLDYPVPISLSPRAPGFQRPTQLLSFSYSEERVLEFTNAAMKYFVRSPVGADLSYRYETWVKRPEVRGRLDGLLEATLQKEAKGERERASVVSWRGVMTKILIAPYEEREGFDLNVMFVNGTMYLEEHLTDVKLQEKENMTPRNRLQSYYGYAFESHCTSSTPNASQDSSRSSNGWSGDVNTNVQWCSVAKTKLGENRMIIGGEVDCVRDRYNGTPDTFVELKTSLTIRNPQDEARFEKKLLKFYFQSFLLGVPEIVVGFRTPAGHVTTIQSFKTIEIPRLVRGKQGAWDPNRCLAWGEQFLSFLKSVVGSPSNVDKQHINKLQENQRDNRERVWRVRFEPRVGVQVMLLDGEGVEEVRNGEDRVGFLPRFFWDAIVANVVTACNGMKAAHPVIPPGWNIV